VKRGAKRRREGPKKKTEREREERQRERERERGREGEGEREREIEQQRFSPPAFSPLLLLLLSLPHSFPQKLTLEGAAAWKDVMCAPGL
jgi:hypothetical protein